MSRQLHDFADHPDIRATRENGSRGPRQLRLQTCWRTHAAAREHPARPFSSPSHPISTIRAGTLADSIWNLRTCVASRRCGQSGIGTRWSGSSLVILPVFPEYTAGNPRRDTARDQEGGQQELRRRVESARFTGNAEQEPTEEMAPSCGDDTPSCGSDESGYPATPRGRIVPWSPGKRPDDVPHAAAATIRSRLGQTCPTKMAPMPLRC